MRIPRVFIPNWRVLRGKEETGAKKVVGLVLIRCDAVGDDGNEIHDDWGHACMPT